MPFAISFLFALLAIFKLTASQGLTNVKSALFRDNKWVINVNYLSSNSSDFWSEYILKADCETVVKFQEVFCLGKSVNVTITDIFDSTKVRKLFIKSNQTFSCSSNVENPNETILNSRYSRAEIVLPTGTYSIKMKLDKYKLVLGYRGYAVKASIPLERTIINSKCRDPRNPNERT
jgi:hypothetical protein